MNVVMTGDGAFVEVQGTAEGAPFDRAMLDSLLALAEKGCADLTGLQREALAAMTQVFLASRNAKKLVEMRRILVEYVPDVEVLGLDDVAPYDEPAETEPTFAGNALLKAHAAVAATGLPSLADDSGLCVDALNGMPGVLSARWAGAAKDDRANNRLLLDQLADVPDERRGAHFRCAVAFAYPVGAGGVAEHVVHGEMPGRVIREMRGERRLRLRRAVRAPTGDDAHLGRAVGRGEGRDLPPRQGAARDRARRRRRPHRPLRLTPRDRSGSRASGGARTPRRTRRPSR